VPSTGPISVPAGAGLFTDAVTAGSSVSGSRALDSSPREDGGGYWVLSVPYPVRWEDLGTRAAGFGRGDSVDAAGWSPVGLQSPFRLPRLPPPDSSDF
jgi:hypothetical protein